VTSSGAAGRQGLLSGKAVTTNEPACEVPAFADSLIDSLDTEIDENAEEAWRSEIVLRVRELDAGAVQ
jgi:hypothetical protein